MWYCSVHNDFKVHKFGKKDHMVIKVLTFIWQCANFESYCHYFLEHTAKHFEQSLCLHSPTVFTFLLLSQYIAQLSASLQWKIIIKINISYILLLLEMAEKSILLMAILWIITVVLLSYEHCWEPLVQCIYNSHQAEQYFDISSPRFIRFLTLSINVFKTMTPVPYCERYIVHTVHRFPS